MRRLLLRSTIRVYVHRGPCARSNIVQFKIICTQCKSECLFKYVLITVIIKRNKERERDAKEEKNTQMNNRVVYISLMVLARRRFRLNHKRTDFVFLRHLALPCHSRHSSCVVVLSPFFPLRDFWPVFVVQTLRFQGIGIIDNELRTIADRYTH